ncbi:RNA polymerase-associated protein RapA [Leucothrix pacifica]|uniref:RNA polymerase-associated protein RapA n=1 Tax=Leucothrix pacifica TaxID=1247513 RepID=A0A317CU13_9GAMM|nr:RNA polymerase-associated protein RapA [Leucothrix pacifica]PWQ99812.1 RNA polymerase-associated protein RapA [Leucothrix pacifica]
MDFIVGQRWVSHTEAQLGLGVISEVADRLITVNFPAVEEERSYAVTNAPLSRVIYKVGEKIQTNDGKQLIIDEVLENNGVYIYFGSDPDDAEHIVPESNLDCFVQLTSPVQRLFSSQLDRGDAFRLRVKTLSQTHRLQQSGVTGLMGSRTNLLPHQIYIANEVAQRYAPRVLLADEVGLGKTIEAGMVIHQQIHTGRASRVLLVLPPSLVHQWLVEMRRRFNLNFSIFNEARLAVDESDDPFGEEEAPEAALNPFESEQLIMCSLDFLANSPMRQEQIQAAGFDLMVVDEAHHLEWSPEQASHEYSSIEALAKVIPGVLLLTATPEQLGIESHFARLRLLDPSRFHDLETFRQEEAGYQALNDVVQPLLSLPDDAVLSDKQLASLKPYLKDGQAQEATSVSQLIRQLLDQHGTGRVLFRNTRAAIPDFPERELHGYPLEAPSVYSVDDLRGVAGLTPETAAEELLWLSADPRVNWLEEKLKALKPQKALVICANAETAVALEGYLQLRAGIRSAAFYEGLSVVERDRAAAYFTDEENGAQVLVCSEIGSEGRNFQFAQHLILFDLPLNPDLLEQRIGRLDRIGQKNTIQIHVPYLEDSAQEVLFKWYEQGLNQFTQSCAVGKAIYERFEDALLEQLEQNDDAIGLETLIADTAEYTEQMREALEQGRDRLLEINSCNKDVAAELINKIEVAEDPEALDDYLELLFDCFNIDQEYHSQQALILRPTEQMLTDVFPGLRENDMTVTTDRQFALSREDMDFLSWEHPLVADAMDMILSGETGNATVATLPVKGLSPGSLLLEVVYGTRCIAPKSLQLESCLPLTPTRMLLTAKGTDYAEKIPHELINQRAERVKKATAQAGVAAIRTDIEAIIEKADALANQKLPALIEMAQQCNRERLQTEVARLKVLQAVNPAIRDEEIEYFTDQIALAEEHLQRATLEIQAIRVLITV